MSTATRPKVANNVVFLRVVHFEGGRRAAEFKELYELPGRVFRLNAASLKTRISNVRNRGLETHEEERALAALGGGETVD